MNGFPSELESILLHTAKKINANSTGSVLVQCSEINQQKKTPRVSGVLL